MNPVEWPETFAEGWRRDKPAGFIDFFLPLIDEHAVFTQPLAPTATGHTQIREMFELLFTRFPDFMVTPEETHVHGDLVTIRSTCTVTVGRRHLSFPAEDRLHLRAGRIARREARFSPGPLVRALALSPGTWPRLLTARLS